MGATSVETPDAQPPVADGGTPALLRHSVLYAVARIGLSALDVVLLPLYARVLSARELGLVGVAASILTALGIAYAFGFDGALQPLFFRHPRGSSFQRAVVAGCTLGMTVPALVLAVTLTMLGPEPFGRVLEGVDARFFRLVVWGAFLNLFVTVWLQLLQLRQRSRDYLWLSLGAAGLRAAATVVVLLVLGRGAQGWAEALFFSSACLGVAALVALQGEVARFSPGGLLRDALPFALPMFVHQTAAWLSLSAGRLILNQLTTLEAVGLYQVAQSVGQAFGLVATAVNFAYAPAFMSAASVSPEDAGRRFGAFASDYLAALACAAVVAALFREQIVRVAASEEFRMAAGIVPIVLATAVVQAFYYVLAGPIFFNRRTVRTLPAVTLAGAVIGLGATYVLVPRFGAAGAAWASLAAGVIVVVLALPLSQRSVRMDYQRARLGLVAGVGVGTVVLGIFASRVGLNGPAASTVLAAAFVGLAVWLGILRPAAYREMLVMAFPRRPRAA